MSIDIKVGDEANSQATGGTSMKMIARKSIDGHIMIMDHKDVDIVIVPDKKKIIIFPKVSFHDKVYATQERLFNFLAKRGVIKRETIQSSDVFGGLECEYPDAVKDADATQLVVFSVGKFLEEEKPHMEMEQRYEEEFEKRLTDPDEEESTDLGEIGQSSKKGTIDTKVRRYMNGGTV